MSLFINRNFEASTGSATPLPEAEHAAALQQLSAEVRQLMAEQHLTDADITLVQNGNRWTANLSTLQQGHSPSGLRLGIIGSAMGGSTPDEAVRRLIGQTMFARSTPKSAQ